jgi:hypothetical protein
MTRRLDYGVGPAKRRFHSNSAPCVALRGSIVRPATRSNLGMPRKIFDSLRSVLSWICAIFSSAGVRLTASPSTSPSHPSFSASRILDPCCAGQQAINMDGPTSRACRLDSRARRVAGRCHEHDRLAVLVGAAQLGALPGAQLTWDRSGRYEHASGTTRHPARRGRQAHLIRATQVRRWK